MTVPVFKKIKTTIDEFLDKPAVRKVWGKLKNKYVLTFLAFFVWVAFIDENNLINRFITWREYKKMEQTKVYYEEKIKTDRDEMEELDKNKNLERLAREKYLMKRDNEDIYVIKEDE